MPPAYTNTTGTKMPKQILEKIPNKYEILYGFLKSTINGVVLVDATSEDMPVFYSNDAFTRITGYERDEILGRDRRILRGPNTSKEAANYIDKAIASLKEVDIETTFHKKDGTPFFCNLIATPIFDEFGHIKYYLIIFRDITYKQELRTLKFILGEEMKLSMEYKTAIDESSIVSKTDINGIITHVNEAFCKVSGYERYELLGEPHNIIRHPDMPKEAFKEMWETILAKKTWKGIVKNRKKDGSAYYVDATVKPILDTKGNIVEFISIRHDITEQLLAKEAAQKALADKSAFFAKASHELRTPLNAIINFTELVLDEFDDMFENSEIREQNHDFLKRISANSKHLLSLINDLLDISKLERKGLELTAVDLKKTIQNAADVCMLSAKKKNIDFRVFVEPEELFIRANERALLQIFLNLLSNAVKFTDAGYVEIGYTYMKDSVEIWIRDSGRGIAKEKIDKIFEPFEQVSETDEGTGLGLKLVKDMCEAMNITINVESEKNKGTVFRLLARRVNAG